MTSPTNAEDTDGDELCPVCDEREATTTVANGDEVCAECATMFGSVRSESGSDGSTPRSDADDSASTPPHDRVAARLRETDLNPEEHFIDVHDGGKRSTVSHTDLSNRHGPDGVTGNYGIYATGDDLGGLVALDVDDYDDDVGTDALTSINDLPATLTVETPHTDGGEGGHSLYAVVPGEEFETAQGALEAVTRNTKTASPTWGDIRVANGYVVGPGSQLDGCDKAWCDECTTSDGGWYKIAADRPIATITADEFAEVLRADPKYQQTDARVGEYADTDEGTNACGSRTDAEIPTRIHVGSSGRAVADLSDADLLERARTADNGEKFTRLFDRGDTSGYPSQSEADLAFCDLLAFWTGGDADRMDRLFRDSALMRSKWDKQHYGDGRTYGEATIQKALSDRTEFYNPAPDASDAEITPDTDTADGVGDTTWFHGPPESVVRDDGTLAVVMPGDDHTEVRSVALGTWRCRNCGATTTSLVHADTDASDLSTPGECPGCDEPSFTHRVLDRDAIQTTLRANRMWHPPSGVTPDDFDGLWDDVRAFIHDYWDAGNDDTANAVYAGLTAYALTTWVRENLTFVPHLLTLGRTTGGKTRLLNTLGRVSYRAIVTASASPASMYRLIDRFDVSYFISEYHGLQHETRREIDNVVRAGQKRGEVVTRAEQTSTGYEPTTFDPFAHVAVATQYDVADDIKNRCIRTRSSGTHREMPATFEEDRATALRDRLLYVRFRLLHSEAWSTAEENAYAYLRECGIDGRTREKLLSLVTVAFVWDRLDADFEAFVDLVVEQDREAAADSEDALFVEVVRDLTFDAVGDVQVLGDGDPFSAVELPYSEITDRFEEMTGEEKTPSWLGHVRKRLGFEKEKKRDGTVIADPDLGPKLRRLCDDLGLDWERTDTHDPAPELPEDEKGPGTGGCSECGRDRTLTHRNLATGSRICADCAEDVRAADREHDHSGSGSA